MISPARPIEAQIGTKPRLALPEGQVAPTSQRKVGDSSPTDDMANAEKKKLNTAAEELQPSAPSGYNISVVIESQASPYLTESLECIQ